MNAFSFSPFLTRSGRLRLILLLALTAGPLGAQEPDPAAVALTNMVVSAALDTNETATAEEEPATAEDSAAANDTSSTNGAPSLSGGTPTSTQRSGRDARTRRFRRQRANQTNSAAPESGAANAAPVSFDYAAFKVVADRNIFDPNRYPHRPGMRARPRQVDSFKLVGTMTYEKGTFAFFDGSSSEYRKALKTAGEIAGYKLGAISPNSVKLLRETNLIELQVGMQMRREEDGPWEPSTAAISYTSSTSKPASDSGAAVTPPPSSGAESDIVKRMMQRREQQ